MFIFLFFSHEKGRVTKTCWQVWFGLCAQLIWVKVNSGFLYCELATCSRITRPYTDIDKKRCCFIKHYRVAWAVLWKLGFILFQAGSARGELDTAIYLYLDQIRSQLVAYWTIGQDLISTFLLLIVIFTLCAIVINYCNFMFSIL